MLSKREQRVVQSVIDRLSPDSSGECDTIRAFLADHNVRLWLDSWVLPDLRAIMPRAPVSGDK